MSSSTGPGGPDGDGAGDPSGRRSRTARDRARTGIGGGVSLFGIPVRIDASFLIIVLLLGWGFESDPAVLLVWVAVATVSVLVHELGHAFAFRAFGHTPRIDLFGLGGATSSRGGPELGAARQLLVSVAGPMAGLLLGGAALAVAQTAAPEGRLVDAAVTFLILASIGWSLLNLLPVLPLDGGRVLESGLELLTGRRQHTAALAVSALVAITGAGVALVFGQPFSALLAGWFAVVNVMGLRQRGASGSATPGLDDGYRQLATGDTAAAADTARRIGREAASDDDRAGAAHLMAWARMIEGRAADAARALEDAPTGTAATQVLRREVVRAAGGRDEAVRLLRDAHRARPGVATASTVLAALVEDGRLDDAVTFLDGLDGAAPGTAALRSVAVALYETGRYRDAGRVADRGADDDAGPFLAYHAARSWGQAGDIERAVTSLERAVDAGFDDLRALDGDPGLANLRGGDGFERIRARVAGERADDAAVGMPGLGGAGPTGPTGPVGPAGRPPVVGTGSCYRHHGAPARGACPRCDRPICGRCTIPTTAGVLCPPCIVEVGQQRRVVSLGLLVSLVVIGVVFLVQQTSPGITRDYGLFAPAVALEGEWYRLLTSMVLHGGIAHIAFNGYALWLFGRQAELALGTLRYTVLFVASGFVGSAAHYAFGPCVGLAVGASGGVFGVLGGLAWFVFQRRDVPQARSQLKGIVALIAINLVFGLAVPQIADLAHIGGLLSGAVLVAGFDRYRHHVPGAIQIAVVVAVVAAGAWLSMWRTDTFLDSCATDLFEGAAVAPAGAVVPPADADVSAPA